MASPAGIINRTNMVVVIVNAGGVQIPSNSKIIHPVGGPDNNPFATAIISQNAMMIGETKQIEDATVNAAFQSDLGVCPYERIPA